MSENQKPYKLMFIEWISSIAVFVTCFAYLNYKIDKQSDRIEKQSERLDQTNHVMMEQFARQSDRTDKLYEMFIEIVKERK